MKRILIKILLGEIEELIPTQRLGQQTDAHERKKYDSSNQTKLGYPGAVARLLDVNNWYGNAMLPAAKFFLFDSRERFWTLRFERVTASVLIFLALVPVGERAITG